MGDRKCDSYPLHPCHVCVRGGCGGYAITSPGSNLKQCRLLASGQVPYSRRFVPTAGGKVTLIGAEGDAVDDVGVALSGEIAGAVKGEIQVFVANSLAHRD